jgi:hypothetical protein
MKNLLFIPIVLFLIVLWAPAIQMHYKVYQEFEDADKRVLPGPPVLGREAISSFAEKSEAYVDDHFGFRPDLIRWNVLMRVHLFGVVPLQSVIAGKNTWLFYRSEALDDGDSINDFMGTVPLSSEALEDLRRMLDENNRRFTQKGIKYIVAIAPNKNAVYSENLPERFAKNKARTRLEQFCEYMENRSDVNILDLTKPLSREKSKAPLYWATDSHWNSFGAYVAYREIMKRISDFYPDTGVITLAGEVDVKQRTNGGDLAQMLFIQDVWPEKEDTLVRLDSKQITPQFEKLLFRHDSFGDALYPYLTKHFKKIISAAPFAPFGFEAISREQPEIVLHLFAERYLTRAIHDDFHYREPGY